MALSTEDRLAILDLIGRYSQALDLPDKDAYAALWIEDGVFEYGTQETVRGRAALRARFANAPPEGVLIRHWTTNLVIEGDGESAKVSESAKSGILTRKREGSESAKSAGIE